MLKSPLLKRQKGKNRMRLNEILAKKGIKINEENSWNTMCHPAKDGQTRWGIIRKEIRIASPTRWGDDEKSLYSIVGIEINTMEDTIGCVHLMGTMPLAKELFLALLADRDVRRLILEYQKKERQERYKMWEKTGISGCRDIFVTFGEAVGNFAVTRTIKLCHISCFDRLNEGFGNRNNKMYIGDFVELCVYLGLTGNMKVRTLRKRAKVKYLLPRLAEEIDDTYSTKVSQIL